MKWLGIFGTPVAIRRAAAVKTLARQRIGAGAAETPGPEPRGEVRNPWPNGRARRARVTLKIKLISEGRRLPRSPFSRSSDRSLLRPALPPARVFLAL